MLNGVLGPASLIPALAPATGAEAAVPRRGGEAEPSTMAAQIKDPELRAAFMRAYRAWEKEQVNGS